MKRYALALVFCLLGANAAFAQTKSPVEGVWKIAERIVPRTAPLAKGVTITNTNPPSLIIFKKGYYSQVYETGGQPRAAVARAKDPQNLTDAEKIVRFEQWRPLFANAGTYEIIGIDAHHPPDRCQERQPNECVARCGVQTGRAQHALADPNGGGVSD